MFPAPLNEDLLLRSEVKRLGQNLSGPTCLPESNGVCGVCDHAGLPLRGHGDEVVSLASSAALAKQLHQGHRHVGRRLHPGRDADWTHSVRRSGWTGVKIWEKNTNNREKALNISFFLRRAVLVLVTLHNI